MRFLFHPAAEAEMLGAADWYEDQEPGLGRAFAAEAAAAVLRVLEYPEAWPVLIGDFRRCRFHKFPFGVIYSLDEGEIFIVAVMHLHREPDYWTSR